MLNNVKIHFRIYRILILCCLKNTHVFKAWVYLTCDMAVTQFVLFHNFKYQYKKRNKTNFSIIFTWETGTPSPFVFKETHKKILLLIFTKHFFKKNAFFIKKNSLEFAD